MKTLIAYFSHRGMNYAPGGMVELKVGNTERAAKAAAELTGAPLFEIRAERDYPFDYPECVEVSKRELKENARPALYLLTGEEGDGLIEISGERMSMLDGWKYEYEFVPAAGG